MGVGYVKKNRVFRHMATVNKTSEKAKKATNQVTIPFRLGELTSKASIQPAIYEALLARKNGNVKETRSLIKDLATEACKTDSVTDVSLYVQSKALLMLMPKSVQSKVSFNPSSEGRKPVRYTNPVSNKGTKMTTLTVLIDILDHLFGGLGQDIHKNHATQIHQAKAREEEALKAAGLEVQKKCDVSHMVRERIINSLMSAIDA